MTPNFGPEFTNIDTIATGGWGEVYKADWTSHSGTTRTVALKRLKPDLADDSPSGDYCRSRFQIEAAALKRLRHPNIIECLSFAEAPEGFQFIVMPFVKTSLHARRSLRQETNLISIAVDVADALTHSHRAGVFHRDLKPGNLLIGENDEVKLTDFGLAGILWGLPNDLRTQASDPFGTRGFVAPEVSDVWISGDEALDQIDWVAADIYSFGALLYALATEQSNSLHTTGHEKRVEAIEEDLRDAKASTAFIGIVRKCLAGSPEDRYATMAEVQHELLRLPSGRKKAEERLDQVFHGLEKAWTSGRQIIVLAGSGISSYAGIATSQELSQYFSQIKKLAKRNRVRAAQCLDGGWPDRLWLYSQFADDDDSVSESPSYGLDWLRELGNLTKGRTPDRRKLFDRLVEGKSPSTAHHLLACLTRRLNLSLLWTTCFDDLIPASLGIQGVIPEVFDADDDKSFPDFHGRLGRPVVLKLHGGDPRLVKLGEDADRSSIAKLFESICDDGPQPVLLVMGYSGSDQRVCSIVQELCERNSGDDPSVYWLHRSQNPPEAVCEMLGGDVSPDAIRFQQYHELEHFLNELYCRLTTSHPVSKEPYRALIQVPRWANTSADLPETNSLRKKKVLIYGGDAIQSRRSTSSDVSTLTTLFPQHHLIWCDLEEIPSVDGLIAAIHSALASRDYDVPPLTLLSEPSTEWRSEDPRALRIAEALQRGRYLLVFDAINEFGKSHVSESARSDILPEGFREEYQKLCQFFEALARHSGIFGQSRLAMSNAIIEEASENRGAVSLVDKLGDRNDVEMLPDRQAEADLQLDHALIPDDTRKELRAALRKKGIHAEIVDRLFSEWTNNDDRIVLAVASAFRRPRSIVAMRRLAARLLDNATHFIDASDFAVFAAHFQRCIEECTVSSESTPHSSGSSDTFSATDDSGWLFERNLDPERRQRIDSCLHRLCAAGLLIRLEGGFYWMDRVIRDTIYQSLIQSIREATDQAKMLARVSQKQTGVDNPAPRGDGDDPSRESAQTPTPVGAIGNLHDVIAEYYYDRVFQKSKDPTAFSEFLFHRLASIQHSERSLSHRLEDLGRALERHHDHLLSSGHAETINGWTSRIHVYLDELEQRLSSAADSPERRLVRRITAQLCDLESEVRRQSGDLIGCIGVRLRQIISSLSRAAIFVAEAPKTDSITAARPGRKFGNLQIDADLIKQTLRDRKLLEEIRQLVLQVVPVQAMNPRMEHEAIRILRYAQDIAICAKSLRVNPSEDTIQLLVDIRTVTDGLLLFDEMSEAGSRAVRSINVRSAFRIADAKTDNITGWPPAADNDTSDQINSAMSAVRNGRHSLRSFPGLPDREDSRIRCFLNTVGARAAYLQDKFTLAYEQLDLAESTVLECNAGSDRTSYGVCRLHRANCLMLHADFQLRKKTGPRDDDQRRGILPELWHNARAKLEAARNCLLDAYDILPTGRPNVWWWTWLCQLSAQWQHECFALCLDGDDSVLPGTSQPLSWTNAIDGRVRHPYLSLETPIPAALRAVRDGLDCAELDARRRIELRVLWWQLFICRVFSERNIAHNFWATAEPDLGILWPSSEILDIFNDVWMPECKDAGLEDFALVQHATGDDVLAQLRREEFENWSEQVAAHGAERFKKYETVNAHSLRDVLLTLEDIFLKPLADSESTGRVAVGVPQDSRPQRDPLSEETYPSTIVFPPQADGVE